MNPPPPFHPSRLSRSTERRSLCYAAASRCVTISLSHCVTLSHVLGHICQCYPFSLSTPPPLCPQLHSLHLHLYFCPADRFICTIFLDSLSCVTSGQSLSSLCFSFLLCKMGRIILLALLRLSRVSAGTILIAVAFTLGSPVQGPVINS